MASEKSKLREKIAKELNVSRAVVWQVWNSNEKGKTKINHKGVKKLIWDALKREGISLPEKDKENIPFIAKKLGCSKAYIHLLIKRMTEDGKFPKPATKGMYCIQAIFEKGLLSFDDEHKQELLLKKIKEYNEYQKGVKNEGVEE